MKSVLKLLAMSVWYIGSIALFVKSYKLFKEAYIINSEILYIVTFLLIALVLSLVKIKYIFIKSCRKNLDRIDSLQNPKIWQFYKAGFFVFLVAVISLGAMLSYLAKGDYYFLLIVASIDLALALALFVSGFLFFKELILS